MQVYYEIETDIPSSHQLNIQLPDTIPAGRVKIAVFYEVAYFPTHGRQCHRRDAIYRVSNYHLSNQIWLIIRKHTGHHLDAINRVSTGD